MAYNQVMMVDDDVLALELHQMIIGWEEPHRKYSITKENGLEAIRYLESLADSNGKPFPKYILLDLNMPEMDGLEFLQEFESRFPVKKDEAEVIILTSSIRKKDKEDAFKYESVKDYIIKPVPEDYVKNLIIKGR
jgi:CheY-like chemotaxis protein